MTKTEDAARVARTYALGQRAAERDIELIRQYLSLPVEDRVQFQPTFARWFAVQSRIRRLEWIGSDEFFYPRFAKYLNDGGEFVEGMRERQQVLQTLEEQLRDLLPKLEEHDQVVASFLRTYADTYQEYIDHREAVFVPVFLEHFDPVQQRAADDGFRRRLGLSGVALLLPWMLDLATPEERAEVMQLVPLPFRLLYRYVWDPRYRRVLPNFSLVERVVKK